jgi:putative glycosyltransferase (TIGR04348 family)
MRITLVTPAAPGSRAGNRATATRWAAFLRELGHRVRMVHSNQGAAAAAYPADALVALHAWRSAETIEAAAERHPGRPLVVALTGTDIYRFQHSHPDTTLASMARAHALIGLHDRVADDIPARFADRLYTVRQSAKRLPSSYGAPPRSVLRVLVAGHLRDEKDSLRAAYAARGLPAASRIQVVNVGGAHNEEWTAAARLEAANNPRFEWRGEVAHWQVRRLMASAHAMVMSSVMEGGANVISEACVAGLPIIASDIPGNRGLLGDEYPAYYPAADTAALRELLQRAEQAPAFLADLRERCRALAPHFTPAAEREGLDRALQAACAVASPHFSPES